MLDRCPWCREAVAVVAGGYRGDGAVPSHHFWWECPNAECLAQGPRMATRAEALETMGQVLTTEALAKVGESSAEHAMAFVAAQDREKELRAALEAAVLDHAAGLVAVEAMGRQHGGHAADALLSWYRERPRLTPAR